MAEPYGPWRLDDFESKFDEWSLTVPLPGKVYADIERWITTRTDRPRGDAVLVDGEEDVWLAPVAYLPDLDSGLQRVVRAYRIIEVEHRIVCELFAVLPTSIGAEADM
ncbi:hypothetical protein ACGFJ7_37585 [Actinoplanes sp. NPDC048988]|uniref:hypothetical protein n=1 Tax=Actinoplanes sp. NPDC048988 TaxID=3363901 RepID=UPI0037161760